MHDLTQDHYTLKRTDLQAFSQFSVSPPVYEERIEQKLLEY